MKKCPKCGSTDMMTSLTKGVTYCRSCDWNYGEWQRAIELGLGGRPTPELERTMLDLIETRDEAERELARAEKNPDVRAPDILRFRSQIQPIAEVIKAIGQELERKAADREKFRKIWRSRRIK